MGKDIIYVDKERYNEIKRTVIDLRKKLNGLSASYEDNARSLYYYTNLLSKAVIIEKGENKDLVDLNNIINVTFLEDNSDFEFQLVAREGNFDTEIPTISINSPLGKAVYKKHVGDECSYNVAGKKTTVIINSKLELDLECDNEIKSL